MQMPEVKPEMKKLTSLFTGTWRGEEKLFPSEWDPKGGPAYATWVVHPSLDGFFLMVDYAEERDGKVVYRGHGLHAWDDEQKCYFAYWFDNVGVVPQAPDRATLDGGRYTYTSAGGQLGQNRFTYLFEGDRLTFTIEKSTDGKSWAPMHEGRYTRSA